MSLLSICTMASGAARIPVPQTIVGNLDESAQLLLQLANDEGEALARRKPGGWAAMVNQFTFTTVAIATTGTLNGTTVITGIPSTTGILANIFQVFGAGFPNNSLVQSVDSPTQVTITLPTGTSGAGQALTFGQSDYPLPSDFQRTVDGTFWDRSRFWQMRGALSPQQWQLYKSSVLGTSATVQRRYRIREVSGTLYLSIDPVPSDNNSTLVFEYVSNGWCANASTGARQNTWLADTDVGVLDEFLIRKGVQYRLLERLGMAYDVAASEYEDLADKAMAHDGGTEVLEMVKQYGINLISPWNVADTGFGQSSP